MPTYEYKCENCEHFFEQFQSITAKSLKKCPECGKMKLNRLIGTGAGIIFKGDGFYQTDYRDKSYTEAAKKDSDSQASTTDTKKDTKSKSDDKPAKSENKSTKKSDTKAKSA